MFSKPMLAAIQDCANAAASVMTTHDDMLYTKRLDCELKHGHAVEIGRIDQICDIAVNEDFAGRKACDHVGWDATIGTPDPKEVRFLQSNQAPEVVSVCCNALLRPLGICFK
jgi:hypothetical protein